MNRLMKKDFIAVFVVAAVSLVLLVGYQKPAAEPINKTADGVALKGYDAVAYFKDGQAVRGSDEFAYEWMSSKWYFASEANRGLFASDPEKYAPQYGGYCAWAVGHEYTAPGDPTVWKIFEGKLYLNYNKDVQKMWEKDIPGLTKKGDENWPRLIRK